MTFRLWRVDSAKAKSEPTCVLYRGRATDRAIDMLISTRATDNARADITKYKNHPKAASIVAAKAREFQRLLQLHASTIVFILLTWAFVLPLAVPSHVSDRSIYAFVGDRLLAGDRLYFDVYDNKDPLFYYII